MAAKRGVKRSSKFAASPDRLKERSLIYHDGTSGRQAYNRVTYGQVDVSNLGNARDDMDPYSRGGWGHGDPSQRHNVPRRQAFRTSTKSGKGTRVGSTNKALQSADVSMMQGYENRRTTKNIQAYKGMR